MKEKLQDVLFNVIKPPPLLLYIVSADENPLSRVPMVTRADGAVGVCRRFYRSRREISRRVCRLHHSAVPAGEWHRCGFPAGLEKSVPL